MLFFFIMTAAVTFMIGLSKGGLGGMMGALATPLMALALPVDQVIGLLLPILMFADLFAVALHWRRWHTRLILWLLPGTIAGVTIGTFFITNAPTGALRTGLGVIILLFALYKLVEKRLLGALTYHSRAWHAALAGTAAGFSSTLAHTGGPPISIYLLLQNVSPPVFVATSALFFAILNWIKVPYYLYAGLFDWALLGQVAWLLPLAPLGVWLGRKAADKISRQRFEQIIVALLILTAALLIFD